MKTTISSKFIHLPSVKEAEDILRSCVHCGFCNATCPTYQELQDERDGPRGRIYLMKQFLEGGDVSERTRTHLDRCLTCRSCETTCPSGVKYGRLLDISRNLMEKELPRSSINTTKRWVLRQLLPAPKIFSTLLKLAQLTRPFMPKIIKSKIPSKQNSNQKNSLWPKTVHNRVMLLLQSCGQASATPNTNISATRVLNRLGISLVVAPQTGCCGAVSYHLGAHDEGLDYMRRNIDAWWPAIKSGAEAIVVTASGCGPMVQEYGHLLANDKNYAEKALHVSKIAKDLSEIVAHEDLNKLTLKPGSDKIAIHVPCTLQHGMGLPDSVNDVLIQSGFDVVKTKESHLCCGSAGTYSLLQPKMSQQLLKRKISALTINTPDKIVTANIGCQLHIQSTSQQPVQHWIEILDQACNNKD